MDKTAEQLLKRFGKAKARKTNWDETYRDAQEMTTPQRETFDNEHIGQTKDGAQRVFDPTAGNAVFNFASNLQASLTPAMKKWGDLRPGPQLKENKELAQTLADITEILFTALQNSNFDTQIAETYLDLAIGTGALLAFPGTADKPFNFTAVPLSQLYLEEGAFGRVDTAFRQFDIAGRAIKDQWPDAEIPKDLQDMIDEDPDKRVKLIEGTIPSDISKFDPETEKTKQVKGYKYVVVSSETKDTIVEREFTSSPWIVFRWANLPGEIYGRGPVLTALPAIKTLNEQVKILLQAASIATLGMYTAADDGIMNVENIKLGGGAIIPVSSNPGSMQGPSLAPLPAPGNPNLAQLIIENQQAAINKMLFGDPLGDVNNPVKTATEISLRQQDLAKRIGSAFGKLQFELISPLINRLLDILDELGLIDLGEFRVDGNTIAIEHISPLAQAQSEEDVVRHVRFAETVLGLFGPEIGMGMINPDQLVKFLAEKMNIEKEIPLSEAQVQAGKELLAQNAAQGNVAPTA